MNLRSWCPLLLVFLYLIPAGARAGDSGDAPGAPGPVALLDAPSNLGLRPPRPGVEPGVTGLPDALRATGLAERLQVRDLGRVVAPAYSPDDEPVTGFRNGLALSGYSKQLAERLAPVLASRQFVIVLGGDCSVLLGTSLALRQRGRFGLAFVDGHDDYSPPRDPSRYRGRFTAAGRDLALATGIGPEPLANIDGLGPYIRSSDVVQVGLSRTPEDAQSFDVARYDSAGIATFDIDAIRRMGAHRIGQDVRRRLEMAGTDGFWVHVDADVLDQTLMPAVDSPNPRGMTFDELETILGVLLSSPKAVGMELTIFDPSMDADGRLAKRLADVIEHAARQRPSQPVTAAAESAIH